MLRDRPATSKQERSGSPPANYIFVTTTSEGKPKNDSLRRSHVMRNQIKTRAQTTKSHTASLPRELPFLAAGKRSFRLARHQPQAQPNPRRTMLPLAAAKHSKEASVDTTSPPVANRINRHDPPQGIATKVENLSTNDISTLLRLSTSPLLLFGNSRIDTFGVLPMKLTPWDEVLVDRFCHYEKWPWCPVSGQSLWSPFALSDELAFSATMYSWSVGVGSRLLGKDASTWLEFNPEIMQHRLSTISLVNARISNPEEAVKDQTIAAVTMVANLELLYGTTEAASQHMNGLKALVDMRGGFTSFVTPLQLLLQRLLSWVDIVYSEVFGTEPMFPQAEIWDLTWNSRDQLALPSSPIGLLPRSLASTGLTHHEVVDTLQDVHELCEFQRSKPMSTIQEHERMLRCDMFMKIESRLNIIVHSTNSISSKPDSHRSLVWRATALGTLVFVHHFLRGNPLRHRQFGILVPMLQETLSQMDKGFRQLAFARPLLFWLLSVGSVASSGLTCHDWFFKSCLWPVLHTSWGGGNSGRCLQVSYGQESKMKISISVFGRWLTNTRTLKATTIPIAVSAAS